MRRPGASLALNGAEVLLQITSEPYDLAKARAGQGLEPLPWIVSEWGLTSEPWVFLVDKQGNIAGKFEGIVTADELDAAVTPLLATGG